MRNGMGFAVVRDGVRHLSGAMGRMRRTAGVVAAALLVAGIAMPALAQTLTLGNQIFSVTQVGQSAQQDLTLTVNADVYLYYIQTDPADPEFTAANVGSIVGTTPTGGTLTPWYTAVPAGTVFSVPVTFVPASPGQTSSPSPIARNGSLQVVYVDAVLGLITANLPLQGTGAGPRGVLSPGLISDLVGSDATPATAGYGGDGGPAAKAIFTAPGGLAMDVLGNIYIADTGNSIVRVVYKAGAQLAQLIKLENPGTIAKAGNIYTIAGVVPTLIPAYSAHAGAGVDGVLATQSPLNGPAGIAVDAAGNLYISDTNNQAVRVIAAATGLINTVAGTLNNGGAATAAQLYHPAGIAVDGNGNLYIADRDNNAVRVVYIAGTSLASLIAVENSGTTAAAGSIYTIAGGPGNPPGSPGADGDGTLATLASLNTPLAVTVDSAGNIYIADSMDYEVRRVDAVSGYISAAYQAADVPTSLAVDAADNVYFTFLNSCIVAQSQRVYLNSQIIGANEVAGNGTCAASGDGGPSNLAGLNGALGVLADGNGNLYVLEADGVRFVDSTQTILPFGSVAVGNTSGTLSATVMDDDIAGSQYGLLPGGYYSQIAPFTNVPYTNASYGASMDCNAGNYQLSSGQWCGIAIDLQPVADGPFSAAVYYYDNKVITLTGTGTGPLPTATLTGGPLVFTGVVGMGYGAPQTLTLSAGSVNLYVSQIYTSSSYFKETDTCGPLPKVLPANTSCTISISYYASVTTLLNGTVTVIDNASSGGGTQTAALSGTGTAPLAGVAPGTIAFTGTAPGTTSPASIVTVSNTGTAALTFCSTAVVPPSTAPLCFNSGSTPIGPFTLAGNEADIFSVSSTTCGATLAVGDNCTVSATFAPKMAGYYSATLYVNDNSGGSGLRDFYASQHVGLTGSSSVPTGTSNLVAENTTFPPTTVTQTTTQTVTLHLYDAVALKSIAVQSGLTQFSIGTVTGCTIDGATVNPAGTICSIPVTFSPSAPGNAGSATSARTAALIATTTENGGTPYAFGLTGTGTGPVAALTPGIISNYVGGSGGVCTSILGEDGISAANAYVGYLDGMAMDSVGNMYLSDEMNFVIWQVDPQGFIHLYAGAPFNCGGYDQYLNGNGGPALGANVEDGGPLAVDAAGGLYIGNNAANSSASIRYINPVTKVITSVVGSLGNVYNSGTRTNQGNGWVPNTHFYTGSIIQVAVSTPNPVGGGVSNVNYLFTAIQGGTSGSTGPNFPNVPNTTVLDGSVTWNNIGAGTTTGVGCPAQTDAFGDGCTGTNATLYGVSGIALDQAGNLYFADRYTMVSIGNGSEQAVYNAVVRRVDANTGIVTIYAGTGTSGHSGDGGPAAAAKIMPGDLAFDSSGNLYIDEGLYVRRVDASSGIITTVAGSGVASHYQQDVCYGDVGDGGLATSAGFGGVTGIAFDAADNLYLTDDVACNVRRVDAGTQKITTIAGLGSAYGWDTGDINNPYANWDGSAYDASLDQPLLSRVDGMGNIYVMQMSRGVRKIDVSQSVMSFAAAQIDTSSAALTTTVVNAGNSGLVDFTTPFTAAPAWGISSNNWTRDVTNPTGAADCYFVRAIDIGYECPVNVDFTPLAAGTMTGVNTVNDNAANNPQTIKLMGTAVGTPPNVTLLPFLLNFSTPQNGSSTPQPLTLTNNGGAPVTIQSFTLAGTNPLDFTQSNNCTSPLAAGASCTILVTFHPPLVGGSIVNAPPPDILTAQLQVTDSDPSSPQIANLIGIGTLPAATSSMTIAINEAVHVGDGESYLPGLVLNILEVVHASDGAATIHPSMLLNILEKVHIADGENSLAPPTLLKIAETLHLTDALSSLTPSTLLRVAETIHATDALSSVNPSTLLAVSETLHVTDAVAAARGKTTPTVALSSSTNPAFAQNPVVLTATVSSAVSTPTGTVNFTDGGVTLGSGTLTNGVATLSVPSLGVGSHTMAASYGGDTYFVAASSAPVTEKVEDFSLVVTNSTASPSSVTVAAGGTAVFSFTVTPLNGATLPAPVSFSASGLPAGATATFAPAGIAAGAGTTKATVTIQLAQAAAVERPMDGMGRRLAPLALALLLLPLAGRLRRAGRKMGRVVTALVLLLGGVAAVTGLNGCTSNAPPQPQSYTITITGSAGALAHSGTASLTVE